MGGLEGVSMKLQMTKKGLSPIIGTVLLIVIVITVGGVIFAWSNNFILNLGPTGLDCSEVNFEAGVFENKLEVVNKGNVDILGFRIKLIERSEVSVKETIDNKVYAGGSAQLNLGEVYSPGDELLIIPIVREGFVCEDRFAEIFEIAPGKAF
jgi:flagellin-like protein